MTQDVKEISLTIHNQKGLHARAAAKFVNVTSKFESEIKVSRENENALITDPNNVIEHIRNIKETNSVKTINGNFQKIKFDTICIHSDTNNSIDILKKINKEFNGR